MYKEFVVEALGSVCQECGSKENLVVHHKDRDRSNNSRENFMLLCRECHLKVHRGKSEDRLLEINLDKLLEPPVSRNDRMAKKIVWRILDDLYGPLPHR